jgi:hypothetical protein
VGRGREPPRRAHERLSRLVERSGPDQQQPNHTLEISPEASRRASTRHAVAGECQVPANSVKVVEGKTRRFVVAARGRPPFFARNLRKQTVLSTDMSLVTSARGVALLRCLSGSRAW